MRIVRILLASLAALLLLASLAAWLVPGRLDWNRYRGTIEALASVRLGRPVTIAGPITLSLLPETELTAADVVVAGNAPGEEPAAPALTVKALRLRVAPLPLLSGRVDARELALSGPELAIDWPLRRGELAGWPPYWLSAFSARIEKGRLRVGEMLLDGIDATMETTEAGGLIAAGTGRLGGQPIRFSARLTAAGGDGASGLNITVEGQGRLAGATGAFAGQLAGQGELRGGGPTGGGLAGRIDVAVPDISQWPDLSQSAPAVAPANGAAPASATPGSANPGSATPGSATSAAPGTSASPPPAATQGATAPPTARGGALKLGATLKAAGDLVSFDDLTIDLAGPGGATALTGTATLQLGPGPRLDAKLSTARLELDPGVTILARASGSGLAIGLELKAEAAAYGGGLMRGLSAALEMTQAQVALRELAVTLPGDAGLRLSGTVQRGDPARPRFDGNVRLAAPRLRDVLRWLDGAGIRLLPDLPAGVLTRTDFRAHAVAEPGLLALDRLEGSLDGTAVNGELRMWPRLGAGGSAAVGAPNGPAIVATLELGDLLLDPWLPDPMHPGALGRGFDVDLRLHAPMAHLRGEEITALSLDAAVQSAQQGAPPQGATPQGAPAQSAPAQSAPVQIAPVQGVAVPNGSQVALPGASPGAATAPATTGGQGGTPSPAAMGRLTLRQLEATIRGVHLVASGMIAEGGRLTDGKLQASTEDATALAELVPPAWRPADSFWRGPALLSAQLAGPTEAMGLKLALDMDDARLEAQPVIDLRSGKWSGPVTLRHPGALRLLGLFGLPRAEGWLGEGSLSVIAQLAGTQAAGGIGRVSAEVLDATAGQMRLSASLALDLTGEVPALGGHVQADTLALPPPAWRDGAPLPFALLRGWRANLPFTARQVLVGQVPTLSEASGTISLADGVLRLDPFTARLGGGALSGTLVANAAADPPELTVTAALADATIGQPAGAAEPGILPLELVAGRVNAATELHLTGHSPAAMLATASGGMTLNVADGVLGGFDLFRVTRAVAAADPRTRAATETALREALAEGVTNFDRLAVRAGVQNGTVSLQEGALAGNAGTADLAGSVGLGTRLLDLRVVLHPAVDTPPEIAFRLTGPLEKPRRSPELAGFLRWLAERPAPTP